MGVEPLLRSLRLVQSRDSCLQLFPQIGNVPFDYLPNHIQIDGKVPMGKLVAHAVDRGKGNAGELRGGIGNGFEEISGSLAKNFEVADDAILKKPVGLEVFGALAAQILLNLANGV